MRLSLPRRLTSRRPFEPGRSPGEVHADEVAHHEPPHLSAFVYDQGELVERDGVNVEEALALVDDDKLTWINVDGLGEFDVLEALWERFDVHPLVREDIINVTQRPKFEEYEHTDYLVVQMVQQRGTLHAEQVSIVIGEGWLLTFQETIGDVFDPVRDRLRKGKPRIRSGGSDYLAYALLDAVIDGFFPVLEHYGIHLEELEEEAIREPSGDTINAIYQLKRELLGLRRALWPLREAITAMTRTEGSELITRETRTFLRDAYDHVVRLMDMVETYRELASSLTDLYYSTLSHKMNEVMKVLTIVATIFIPLTFVAGLYGMNFENMPELGWRYGYFASLGLMGAIALAMVVMFRRRGWI